MLCAFASVVVDKKQKRKTKTCVVCSYSVRVRGFTHSLIVRRSVKQVSQFSGRELGGFV